MQSTFRLPPMDLTLHRDGDDLLVRPLRDSDAIELWHARQSPDIGKYTSIEWPFTIEAAQRLIKGVQRDWSLGKAARFAVLHESSRRPPLFAGTVSLLHIYPIRVDAEVGYWLAPEGRGRGLAKRAVILLRDWAHGTLRLQRLHLMVDLDNSASHAVARAAGFVPIGEQPWQHPTDPTKDAIVIAYERVAGGR